MGPVGAQSKPQSCTGRKYSLLVDISLLLYASRLGLVATCHLAVLLIPVLGLTYSYWVNLVRAWAMFCLGFSFVAEKKTEEGRRKIKLAISQVLDEKSSLKILISVSYSFSATKQRV